MLTGKMVRVRYARDRIVPHYLDAADPAWQETAERLLELFRGQEGKTRGELEDEQREATGDDPGQLVHQGLAKLLEDRCEFEVAAARPPEELRAAVFAAAARRRKETRHADGSPGADDDLRMRPRRLRSRRRDPGSGDGTRADAGRR